MTHGPSQVPSFSPASMRASCGFCGPVQTGTLVANVLRDLPIDICQVIARYADSQALDEIFVRLEEHQFPNRGWRVHRHASLESVEPPVPGLVFKRNIEPHQSWLVTGRHLGVYIFRVEMKTQYLGVVAFHLNGPTTLYSANPRGVEVNLPLPCWSTPLPPDARLCHVGDDHFLFGWTRSSSSCVLYSVRADALGRTVISRVPSNSLTRFFAWHAGNRETQSCPNCKRWTWTDVSTHVRYCVQPLCRSFNL